MPHKDKLKEYHKRYEQKNQEKIRKQKQERYQKNRKEILKKQNEYNQEHKEERKEYYLKNKERITKRKIKNKGLKICLSCGKEFFGYGNLFCSHNCFSKYPKSNKTRQKMGKSKLSENNPMWKGKNIKSLPALHEWIGNHKPKPKFCEICKKNKPYDLANISQEYKRDINDFRWLCRSCHSKEHRGKDWHNYIIKFKK